MKEDLIESGMKNISNAKIQKINKIKESIELLTKEIIELINHKLILKEKKIELTDKRTKMLLDFGDSLSSFIIPKNLKEIDKEISKVGEQINKVELMIWGNKKGKYWQRQKLVYNLIKVKIGNSQKGKVFENYYSNYIDELNKKLQYHIESILGLFNISVPSEDIMLDLMLKVQKMQTSDIYEAIELGADKNELVEENILHVLKNEKLIDDKGYQKYLKKGKKIKNNFSINSDLMLWINESTFNQLNIIDYDNYENAQIVNTIKEIFEKYKIDYPLKNGAIKRLYEGILNDEIKDNIKKKCAKNEKVGNQIYKYSAEAIYIKYFKKYDEIFSKKFKSFKKTIIRMVTKSREKKS